MFCFCLELSFLHIFFRNFNVSSIIGLRLTHSLNLFRFSKVDKAIESLFLFRNKLILVHIYCWMDCKFIEVLRVTNSHLCRWNSIDDKSCSFLIIKGLSLCFLCSFWSACKIPYALGTVSQGEPAIRGLPLTNNLRLDYHIKDIYILHSSMFQWRDKTVLVNL